MVPRSRGDGNEPAGAAPADNEDADNAEGEDKGSVVVAAEEEEAVVGLALAQGEAKHGCMTIISEVNARTLTDTSRGPRWFSSRRARSKPHRCKSKA
jgi:hypothetical protein